jgi:hypothetical protein
MRHDHRKRAVLLASALSAVAAASVTLALVAMPGNAASATAPSNTSPPTISGTAEVGQTLTADRGTWSGTTPINYAGRWRRCNATGGNCSNIGGATDITYKVKTADLGNTLRVRVTASNSDGSATATSAPTAVVKSPAKPPATGCPSGSVAQVSDVTSPARLVIDRVQFSPSVVTRSTKNMLARFHVSDTCNQSVQGALLYATAVPFSQLSVSEQPTGHDGWAEINFSVLAGFPAARQQQLLVIFARARKQGESLLTGISNRRLISVRVSLG